MGQDRGSAGARTRLVRGASGWRGALAVGLFFGAACVDPAVPAGLKTDRETGGSETEADTAQDTALDTARDSCDTGPVDSGETGAPAAPTLALVGDSELGAWLYVRPDTGRIVHRLEAAALSPLCAADGCAAFGGRPVAARGGHDEAILTFQPVGANLTAGGVIQRVRLRPGGGGEVLWELSRLDFQTNFADRPELCDAVTPCGDGASPTPRGCRLAGAHEIELVEETDAFVRLWIADTGAPTRALKVRLDRGQTCGVVEDVVSAVTVEDWGEPPVFNDLDVVDRGDGVERLLLNSLHSGSREGAAYFALWRRDPEGWIREWRFPREGSGGHLASAHNPDWIEGDDGAAYVVYAHSNGLGATHDPTAFDGALDHRGSVGVVRVGEDGPEYLFDAAPSEGFGFVRDVSRLADGTWLVTDSGCMTARYADCARPGLLWHVSLPALETSVATGRSGAFSPGHETMAVVEATNLDAWYASPLACGLETPYSVHSLPPALQGDTLGAVLGGVEACADE